MHRHDTVFQTPSVLADLAALLLSQPPPAVPLPAGRLGMCPFQIQLTDFYGRFHLDDHCQFGRPAALLHFWSTDNTYYNASADSWAPSAAIPFAAQRGCKVPGVESDNGWTWVMDDWVRSGIEPPRDTQEPGPHTCGALPHRAPSPRCTADDVYHACHRHQLIVQRLFVINPERWDHICLRGHGKRELRLPADARRNNVMRPSRLAPAAPYGVHRLCVEQNATYDCSGVGDEVQNATKTPRWTCIHHNSRC